MNESSTGAGIGFTGLLALLFIALKLLGYINWSWWWVLAPIWIPWGIFIIILLIIGLFVAIAAARR